MGFPRQEYWNGLPFPFPGDFPNPGIKTPTPTLTGRFFTSEPLGVPSDLWLAILLSMTALFKLKAVFTSRWHRQPRERSWRRRAGGWELGRKGLGRSLMRAVGCLRLYNPNKPSLFLQQCDGPLCLRWQLPSVTALFLSTNHLTHPLMSPTYSWFLLTHSFRAPYSESFGFCSCHQLLGSFFRPTVQIS